jgi:hypothetical protein
MQSPLVWPTVSYATSSAKSTLATFMKGPLYKLNSDSRSRQHITSEEEIHRRAAAITISTSISPPP